MSVVLLLAAAAPPAAFAPIAPLVGHCWRGVLPDGGVDLHCFGRAGAVVIDRHGVTRHGAAVYTGETRYSVDGRRLRWAYRNAGGPVMAGVVTATPGAVRFGVDGGPPLVWRWRGRRAYVAAVGPQATSVVFRRID